MNGPGGLVAGVAAGSPAARAGIERGDRIVTADGEPLRDLIDWRWFASGPSVTVTAVHGGNRLDCTLSRDEGEWGVTFERLVFDGVRGCRNDCEFCFVSQLPAGLRESLYVRDDDFRLSFLSGNFITLTNVTPDDVARITEQRLSPLYVSLHAVRPDVRRRLLRCAGDDQALERLAQLLSAGISVHVQIVLVPGVNDGEILEETLDWLEGREGVLSVGIVPLGFTAHQDRYDATYDQGGAARVLDAIAARVSVRIAGGGEPWLHAADEFYLTAGRPFPGADEYDGYPQYENGIGLARAFMDEWEAAPQASAGVPKDVVLCTGTLFAPVLRSACADRWGDVAPRVLMVENGYFGGGVSVAGLLTGDDLIRTIGTDVDDESPGVHRYLIPDVILNDDELTLDGLDAGEMLSACDGAAAFVPSTASGLLDRLSRMEGV